jgi:hypothetical protein
MEKSKATIFKVAWWCINIFVLLGFIAYSVKDGIEMDHDIVFMCICMALSFPSSILVQGVFFALVSVFPIMEGRWWVSRVFSFGVENALIWVTFSTAGYFQWFVVVPRVVTWARDKIHKSRSEP